jgi:hypothetical protein
MQMGKAGILMLMVWIGVGGFLDKIPLRRKLTFFIDVLKSVTPGFFSARACHARGNPQTDAA